RLILFLKIKRRIRRCAFALSVKPLLVIANVKPDLRGLLYRLTIQGSWLETVLCDRAKCRVLKNGRATDEFGIGNFSVFTHFYFHNHRSAYMARLGNRWIR